MCGSADSRAEPRKGRGFGHNSNRRFDTLPGPSVPPTRSLVIPAHHELPDLLTPDEVADFLRTTRKAVYAVIDAYARANRHKPSGIESKESHFRTHLVGPLGDKPVDRLGDDDVQQLKVAIDVGNKTVNNVLSTLNKALKTAVEWKVIRVMPCTIRLLRVAPPEMSFYDSDEYERLVAAARAIDSRTHIAVLLGGDAGLRVSEVIALE
jgi:integrase